MTTNLKDMKGLVFNRLIVIGRDLTKPKTYVYWNCKCSCGNTKSVRADSLRGGFIQSCGCFGKEMRAEANTKHGMTQIGIKDSSYTAWSNMKSRCLNEKHPEYPNYGGRNITICDSWKTDYLIFNYEMGPKPNNTSLDRVDNNKGYYKENCRWASLSVQNNNKRNNNYITFNGKTLTLTDWAREINIQPAALYTRIKLGWSTEKMLTTPIDETMRRNIKCQ